MIKFGKRNGGGRRFAPRVQAPLATLLWTLNRSHSVALVDVSATGARVRGDDLPKKGEYVELKMGSVSAFGKLIWVDEGECGITFDTSLSRFDVERLRIAAQFVTLSGMSVEDKMAADNWVTGPGR